MKKSCQKWPKLNPLQTTESYHSFPYFQKSMKKLFYHKWQALPKNKFLYHKYQSRYRKNNSTISFLKMKDDTNKAMKYGEITQSECGKMRTRITTNTAFETIDFNIHKKIAQTTFFYNIFVYLTHFVQIDSSILY